MKIQDACNIAIGPGLSLLPASMGSTAAVAMMIAIGLQESRLMYRAQIKGPARGYWQFERGGLRGVLLHRSTKKLAGDVIRRLDYTGASLEELHAALEHNAAMACAFARLLLYTVPKSLPGRDDSGEGWDQYLAGWRPGKPHPGTWAAHYRDAWNHVS